MLFGLEDKKLERYIKFLLNEEEDYQLKFDDLKRINTLKLSKNVFNAQKEFKTALEIFAKHGNVNTLTLSGFDIGQEEISMLNRLTGLKTLVINNAKIKIGNKQLKLPVENLTIVGCTGKDIGKLLSDKSSEKLKYANISDNKNLSKEDLEKLLENADNLETLTLDGNENLDKIEKPEGVKEFSQQFEYRPVDKVWSASQSSKQSTPITLNQLQGLTDEQVEKKLAGRKLTITVDDLKSEEGKGLLAKIGKQHTIDLQLQTTADLSMEEIEKINKSCNVDKVYVDTGWTETKTMGYSYQTYKAIKQEINDITKNIDPNLSEEEKYLAVRKKLAENITYDDAALRAKPGTHDYYASRNLENALLSHTCVCAGYADVAKNVYAEMGIESKYVEGYTNSGEYHAWNLVKINGQWYQDDLTWDRGGKLNYALLDDKHMAETHGTITYIDDSSIVPDCNAPTPNAITEEKIGKREVKFNNKYNDDYER